MDTASTITSSPAGAQLYSMRWMVAAVVLAANTMDLLDATIVNVAGPSIHRELGGGASTIQWLSAAYTLAFAVLLIAGARLGDIFGRRRMFLLGLVGFTVFSAACAVATPHIRPAAHRAPMIARNFIAYLLQTPELKTSGP